MTTKPRKEAEKVADEIMTHLSSDRHFGTYSRSRENLAEKIERRAIRPVADPLAEALEYCEEQIGWKGDRDQDSDHYACEHCNGPPELDFKDLQHEPHCPVLTIRAALAAYRGEGK